MELLKLAQKTVDIASYYCTLQGHGNISDVTDKEEYNTHESRQAGTLKPYPYTTQLMSVTPSCSRLQWNPAISLTL